MNVGWIGIIVFDFFVVSNNEGVRYWLIESRFCVVGNFGVFVKI